MGSWDAKTTTIPCHRSRSPKYPKVLFRNLNAGSCVNPILNVIGLSRSKVLWMCLLACCKTCPDLAPLKGRAYSKYGSASISLKHSRVLGHQRVCSSSAWSHVFRKAPRAYLTRGTDGKPSIDLFSTMLLSGKGPSGDGAGCKPTRTGFAYMLDDEGNGFTIIRSANIYSIYIYNFIHDRTYKSKVYKYTGSNQHVQFLGCVLAAALL